MMIGDDSLTEKTIAITKQVRNGMSKICNKFNGTFSQGCEMNSVPKSLLDLLASLLEGDCMRVSRGVLSIAQLAMLNFKKNSRKRESFNGH